MTQINTERGRFLPEEGKRLKQEILDRLIQVLLYPIRKNQEKLDGQALTDIVVSCLIMFSREVVLFLLGNNNNMAVMGISQEDFIDHVQSEIKKEIMIRLNQSTETIKH